MPDRPQALAQLTLVAFLVRLLLQERAIATGQTSQDILKWSEELKRTSESIIDDDEVAMYFTAAVDHFFNLLASEVARREGSEG